MSRCRPAALVTNRTNALYESAIKSVFREGTPLTTAHFNGMRMVASAARFACGAQRHARGSRRQLRVHGLFIQVPLHRAHIEAPDLQRY